VRRCSIKPKNARKEQTEDMFDKKKMRKKSCGAQTLQGNKTRGAKSERGGKRKEVHGERRA